MILNLFINDYYPSLSKNIKYDSNTIPIIMGGVAFNLNIPKKLDKILKMETDDIDLKIYTTEINDLDMQPAKLSKVLAYFKQIVLIICMYMKQIINPLVEFSNVIFKSQQSDAEVKSHSKVQSKTKKQSSKTRSKTHSKSSRKNHTSKLTNKAPSPSPPSNMPLIKARQMRFGVLKDVKLKLIIKKKVAINSNEYEVEHIDITYLSYDETYKLIMSKLDNPDILIKTKLIYDIEYIKPYKPPYSSSNITFSDTKVIYPSIKNPSYFAQYFMNTDKNLDKHPNKNPNKYMIASSIIPTFKNLISYGAKHMKVADIIETKQYRNYAPNARYISIKSLQIDIVFMLKFAELLINEDTESGVILVPVDCIFKYYKYMSKFIRLQCIKRFYSGTLGGFMEPAKKLWLFIETDLNKKTSPVSETNPLNIVYKKIISDFHQAFFIKKTMKAIFPEYDALRDIVNDYNYIVPFINKSVTISNTVSVNGNASNTVSVEMLSIGGGRKKKSVDMNMDNTMHNTHTKTHTKTILHESYPFDDIDLDNMNQYTIPKTIHIIKGKDTKALDITKDITKDIIIDKIHKMIKTEIQFLNKLSHSIRR